MHPDLARVGRLSEFDAELERLGKELINARSAVADTERVEREAMAARDRVQADLLSATAEERALHRQLDDYRAKQQSATRILETGAGSPDAAQRQLVQCSAILDDLETKLLEMFERQDGLRASLAAAETELAKAGSERSRVANETPGVLARLEAEERAALPKRTAVANELSPEVRQRYDMLRAGKKKVAVARLVDGSCTGCQMTVPAQHISDLRRGLMEPCRGCGRFLLLT